MISEYNTDEETDELLERQYNVSERNNATQPAEANGPDALSAQVMSVDRHYRCICLN